jgi:hypothetical protein
MRLTPNRLPVNDEFKNIAEKRGRVEADKMIGIGFSFGEEVEAGEVG